MDISQFKILKEDADSYHVAHPNGKSMVVKKSGLNEKAHGLIKKLCMGGKYADGGEVTDDQTPGAQVPASLNPNIEPAPVAVDQSVPPALLPTPAPLAQGNTEITQQPGDMSAQGILGNKAGGVERALEAEKMYKNQEGQALANQGQQESKAIAAVDQQIQSMPTQQDIIKQNKDKDDALFQAFANKSIDPNRLFHNQSAGAKVASGLALILGGIGSGLTGQPNQAAQMIKQLVDNDIEAQKSDQSKAMNLWKMNREALGNDLAANLATQNQIYTGLKYKLMQAGAQASSPIALARVGQANAVLDQQIEQNRYQQSLIQYGTGMGSGNQGGYSGEDPSVLIPQLIKEPGMQKAGFEEVKNAQLITKNGPNILKAFDDAARENTMMRTGAGLVRTPGSVLALHQLMLPNFKTIDGTVRQAAMDESFHNITPTPGDFDSKIAEKRAALKEWMASESAAPILKGHGIDVSKFRNTSARSVEGGEEKTMGGIKYTKVPGGWKKVEE